MDSMDMMDMMVRGRRVRFLCGCLAAVVATTQVGCIATRQETALPPEVSRSRDWLSHRVLWVETRRGERVEFGEEGGRIDSVGSGDERVVGVGIDGRSHRYPMEDLTLVRVEFRESNSVGTIVIGSAVATGALIILFLTTFSLGGHT